MDADQRIIKITLSQAWSIGSGIAVGVFVLTMTYASFVDVRSTQKAGFEVFERFKESIKAEFTEEKEYQEFLYKENNRRLDTKTGRNEEKIQDHEVRIKKLESK